MRQVTYIRGNNYYLADMFFQDLRLCSKNHISIQGHIVRRRKSLIARYSPEFGSLQHY